MDNRRRALLAVAAATALLVSVALVFIAAADGTYRLPTVAMSPTLNPGDKVLVRDAGDDLHRGDIVIARTPAPATRQRIQLGALGSELPADVARQLTVPASSQEFKQVSRVVAVGGDQVEARDGRLYVNGAAVDEPYLRPGTSTFMKEPVDVPAGYVYLLGDNRPDARDSRAFGPVPLDTIDSRVTFRYWPLRKIGGV